MKVTIETDEMKLFLECEGVKSNPLDIENMIGRNEVYKIECLSVTLENVATMGAEFPVWEDTDCKTDEEAICQPFLAFRKRKEGECE